jgi:hypothetical protein
VVNGDKKLISGGALVASLLIVRDDRPYLGRILKTLLKPVSRQNLKNAFKTLLVSPKDRPLVT